MVERQNRTMLALLKGFCLDRQQDWPIYLQKAVFSYNSLVHATTGVTPNLLFTGSQKAIPLGNIFPEYSPEFKATPIEFIRRQQDIAQYYFAVAAANTKANLIRQKRNYDKRVGKLEDYKVGDLVLAFVNVVKRKDMRKMTRLWRGPFRIEAVLSGGWAYVLDSGYKVNYENIKKYQGRPHQFAVDEVEEIIIFPSTENVEELDLRELAPDTPDDDSEHSLMNEKVVPDCAPHMVLRDRNKIRRRFDPDFVQDYFSLISETSEHGVNNIIHMYENVSDQSRNPQSRDLQSRDPMRDDAISATDVTHSWQFESWREPEVTQIGNSTPAVDHVTTGTASCANCGQLATSNVTPLAADLSIESFSHFRLTSQSRFLRNYTKLHSNEFLALLHDINHIHNLNNTLTRVASLQQSTYDQLNTINPYPAHLPRPSNTLVSKPKLSFSPHVPFPVPHLRVSAIRGTVPSDNLREHPKEDIFTAKMPLVLLMSLDLKPRSLFQSEVLRALSDQKLDEIFQQRLALGDIAHASVPAGMMATEFIFLFVRTRNIDQASKESLRLSLRKLKLHLPPGQNNLALLAHDVWQQNVPLELFQQTCQTELPATTVHIFNSYARP